MACASWVINWPVWVDILQEGFLFTAPAPAVHLHVQQLDNFVRLRGKNGSTVSGRSAHAFLTTVLYVFPKDLLEICVKVGSGSGLANSESPGRLLQ